MMRILLLLVVAALAACSSNDAKELEPAELVKFSASVELDKVWSRHVGDGAGDYYTLLPLASAGEVLYAVDTEGYLVAVDRGEGRKLWDRKLRRGIASGVGAAGDQLYLGTLDGEVLALSRDDGAEVWRQQLSSEVLAPPQSNGSIVVAQTQDGRLYGLRAEDGSQAWMQEVAVPALTLRGTATPIVTDTAVYAGFASGKILAVDVKDGTLLWEQRVALSSGRTELERVVDINAAPLLVGDILYSGSFQGRLVAINRGTGRGLWAQPASSYNNLAAAGNRIFISDAEGVVRAYNATSGEPEWSNDQLLRRKLSAPQTFAGYVAVADFEGYLHLLDQSSGEFVGRRKIDGAGVRSPMLSVDDILYVYGNSGELVALRAR